MDTSELDSFVQHFKQLWLSGSSAHLDVDTCAGQAWVGLRVRLGDAPRPLHQAQHQPKVPQRSRNSPARQRRRARRLAKREKDAEEASDNVSKETKQDKNLNETEIASKEDCEAVATKATVEEAKVDTDEESKSESEKSVKVYLTEQEKDEIKKARPSYCKLCRTCEEETDTAEDLSYHLMNNHQPQEVLEHYGQKYIQEKRYCIRKGSPFSSWFSTPLT